MKRAVQQTLIEFTKTTLLKGGIREYNFSHPELSDTEERKYNSDKGVISQNPGPYPVVTGGRGGRLRGISKRPRDESPDKRRKETSHLQPSATELTHIAPEEDPGAQPPSMSIVDHPHPPTTHPDHDIDPRKEEGALHL